MTTLRFRRSSLVFTALTLPLAGLLLASCGGRHAAVPPSPASVAAPSVAFVTNLSGDVQFKSGGAWKEASLGQFLAPGESLRTGDGAEAEIQISDHAGILVRNNSTVRIVSLESSPYTIELTSGAVISRVAKLGQTGRFRVQSGNSVIAVKGTRFLVRQENGTHVAVTDGTVSVLPTGIDPQDLTGLTTDSRVRSALEALDRKAVLIEAGHELTLAPGVGETERRVMDDVASRLRQMEQEKSKQQKSPSTSPELLSNLLVYVGQKVAQETPQVQSISQDSRTALNDAGPLNLLPVPKEQKSEQFASAGLASVTIKTDPEDAEIYLGDRNIGKKIFSGLFRKDETVTFTVKKPGYRDKTLRITFTKNLNQTLMVTLEKDKPAYDAQTFLQAVSSGNLGVVDRYLTTGGDPNVRSAGGLPAVAIALGADRASPSRLELSAMPKVLERLLAGGADPNASFNFGGQQLTPLYLVLASGLSSNRTQSDLLATLLKAGADPNIYVQTGNIQVNAVSMTIIVGIERKSVNLDLLNLLLKFGGNANSVMVYQGRIMTPLVASVVVGAEQNYVSLPLVQDLVANGADINGRVNIDGEIGTPLHFAEKYGFAQIASLLKKDGAIK